MSTIDLESNKKKFVIKPEKKNGSDIGPFAIRDQHSPQPMRQLPVENAIDVVESFAKDDMEITDRGERPDLIEAMQVLCSNKDYNMAAQVANRLMSFVDLTRSELTQALTVYEEAGDLAGQESCLIRLLEETDLPEVDRFLFQKNLGNTLLRLQDFEGAEESYFKAFRINSNSDTLLVNIGTLEFRKTEYESAKERFVQAIRINSLNDKAWVGLGLVHSVFGDFMLAIANFETALDHNPFNRTALQLYCEYAYKHGSLQKMLSHIEVYLEQHNQDIEFVLMAAKVCLVLGAHGKSQEFVNQVLVLDPHNTEATELLARNPSGTSE